MKNANVNNTIKSVRSLGVIALILSGFIFLMQGYSDWDGFQRFLAFSGVNLLIGGFGIFCAQVWQEPKGARTMLALAGAGVAAQFAQLGGMIFVTWRKWQVHINSLSEYDIGAYLKTEVPEIFSQFDVQPINTLIATVMLVLIGTPLCRLAFKVLNRQEHNHFFQLFLVNASFLLIPIRSPWMVVAQILVAGIFLYNMIRTGKIDLQKTYTFEKWLSLLISVSPVLIGSIRGLFYVESVLGFLSLASFGVTAGMFIYNEFSYRRSDLFDGLIVALPKKKHNSTLFWTAVTWAISMTHILSETIISEIWLAFVILAPMTLFFGEAVRRNWIEKTLGQVSIIFILIGFGYGQLLNLGLVNGVLLCALAMVALFYGFQNRDRSVFAIGSLAMVAGLIETAVQGLSFEMVFSWINLAGIGIITILLASFLEKKSKRIKSFQSELSQRFSTQS